MGSPAALSSTKFSEQGQREPKVDLTSSASEEAMKRESPLMPRLRPRTRSSSTRPSVAPPAEVLCVSGEMSPKNLIQQVTTEDASPLLALNTEEIPCAPNSPPRPSVTDQSVQQTETVPAVSVAKINGADISESDPLALADDRSTQEKTQPEQDLIESPAQNESLAYDPSPIFSVSPTGPMHSSNSSPISEEPTSPMKLEVPASLSASDSSTVCMTISEESSLDTYPFQGTPSTLSEISGQLQATETSKAATPLSSRPANPPSESAFSPSLQDISSSSAEHCLPSVHFFFPA
ncbi:unnamed protein product [Dibothriocephalus latus]|uniref:Uncharacterized protein n=1 Tax=Dibothriocephalus latus TaxID=60516 RepID=A0A3P7RVV4_DIBLA|nr:unnamed protein product [Dibothriocephalus latus]